MLAVRLDEELLDEIDALAAQQGKKRSAIVREALMRYLEDMQDIDLAKKALQAGERNLSVEEARKELGLED